MNFLKDSVLWIKENWILVSSISANLIIFIKWIYGNYQTNKIGRANLAGRRYKELYIPLCNLLRDVKTESFVAYKGEKSTLLKKLIKELCFLLIFKSNKKTIIKRWKDLRNPILVGPTYDFPWQTPDIEKINSIIVSKRLLLPSKLEEYWINVLAMNNERYEYSDEELDRAVAELIIFIREITKKTRDYLEKKYPAILAEDNTK
ncbi:hypothetical protein [Cytobacillus dafuensis]|uniref:Uncharacterized protein n=1 Tax=Cytobacillus dafuensis TaxID=1742359 RepID=A0A5B8Z4Z6_CYTDA|nr:hypothetical protein [Cytobacillus dafuensis]QED46396.1 hypothetical protein FSZ17_03450 [Cytobacillus dafuensis]